VVGVGYMVLNGYRHGTWYSRYRRGEPAAAAVGPADGMEVKRVRKFQRVRHLLF